MLGTCFIDVRLIDEIFRGNEQERSKKMRFLPDHIRHARALKDMGRSQRVERVVVLLVPDKQLA